MMMRQNSSHIWLGVFYKVLGCALFALVNGLVQGLTGGASAPFFPAASVPFAQLAFLQNAFGTAYMLPVSLRGGRAQTTLKNILCLRFPHKIIHAVHVLSAVLGMLFWYATLEFMPISYAMSFSFTGPVFTILGSWLFLKEPLTPYRWAACFLSIIGPLIITQPFYDSGVTVPFPLWATALPLLSAACWSASKICTRVLAMRGVSTATLTLYLLLFMTPVSGLFLFHAWVTPTLVQWLWIGGLAMTATLAHLTMAHAFKFADVSFLMPFGGFRFLFSWLVGFWFFNESPPSRSLWIGTTILLTSLYLLSHERKAYQHPPLTTTGTTPS